MSDSTLARRTEIAVKIDGVDISEDMNKYLLQMTYTDHEEDKTDDLQISLDDREGIWLTDWLGNKAEEVAAPVPVIVTVTSQRELKLNDIVEFTGGHHYFSSMAKNPTGGNRTAGKARLTNTNIGAPHPYHVIGTTSNVYGWVDVGQVQGEWVTTTVEQMVEESVESEGAKGAEISTVIIQKNWESDGKDRVLECGTFEIDSLDASGPPAGVSIKATSLPHTSAIRTATQTKAWERIKLSAIAGEIARKHGMKCMFESSFDPLYTRKEQVQLSDIVFLQGLCKNAGISLKVSGSIIVLFDESDYEGNGAVREIARGTADVLSYRFGTSTNDTKYSKCHVSYTDPQTGQVIEYTYTPRGASKDGQVLEINEKVKTREEARQLAMKRLRQKNKGEYQAEFTLVGDTRLVAGVNVTVVGWGMFDGKYIIESATHSVTGSGYTLQVKLRRVLEGY
ncbi:hypothetical protein FACS1894111_05660 [Clostridia bacterium]|nr:hypothetical protein FACS1894111_05660 [Clostridia bacterium]